MFHVATVQRCFELRGSFHLSVSEPSCTASEVSGAFLTALVLCTPLMFALGPAKAAAANVLQAHSCYTSFAQLPFSEHRYSLLMAVK